jgi:hypothetical protein
MESEVWVVISGFAGGLGPIGIDMADIEVLSPPGDVVGIAGKPRILRKVNIIPFWIHRSAEGR